MPLDIAVISDLLIERLREIMIYQRLRCGRVENMGKNAAPGIEGTHLHNALTYMDLFTQDYLALPILSKYNNIKVLGEENTGLTPPGASLEADYILTIDPIDGTLAYSNGESDYSILLGLFYHGEIIFAICCYPFSGDIYLARKGAGVLQISPTGNSHPVHIKKTTSDCMRIGCHYRFTRDPFQPLAASLMALGYEIETNGKGFYTNLTGFLRVLNGESVGFIGANAAIHDVAVPAFLIQEAGGCVVLFDNSLAYGEWSEVPYSFPEFIDLASRPKAMPRCRLIASYNRFSANQILDAIRHRANT